MKYRLRCIMGILSGPVARQDEHSRGPLELESSRPSPPMQTSLHANTFICHKPNAASRDTRSRATPSSASGNNAGWNVSLAALTTIQLLPHNNRSRGESFWIALNVRLWNAFFFFF